MSTAAVVLSAWACGGSSPTTPGPPPPPPPSNAAPVIDGIAVERSRLEAGESTTVTATVRDAETPVAQLTFQWSSTGGTFSGQGATVAWRAPEGTETPAEYVLTLTVVEPYGTANAQGVRPEHRVTASSSPVRVHDSERELGELALRFLSDFANSSVSAEDAIREFSDSCHGKQDEYEDIVNNRRNYEILSSSLDLRSVRVDGDRSSASLVVACAFTSRFKECPQGTSCTIGSLESVAGECLLTAVYEQNRWWLCQSNFAGSVVPSMRAFFDSGR